MATLLLRVLALVFFVCAVVEQWHAGVWQPTVPKADSLLLWGYVTGLWAGVRDLERRP
jgi:hypothetical protein